MLYNSNLPAWQVVIEGFKTYKDQTISEPLDQHINVVGEQPDRCARFLIIFATSSLEPHQPMSARCDTKAMSDSICALRSGCQLLGEDELFRRCAVNARGEVLEAGGA